VCAYLYTDSFTLFTYKWGIKRNCFYITYLIRSPRSFPDDNLSGPKAIIMGHGEGMGDAFLLLQGSIASTPSCSSSSSPTAGRKVPVITISKFRQTSDELIKQTPWL
jgi:hypothetical protein